MWLALVLLAQPVVPESPAALAAELFACASAAADPAERRACWLAWASLGAGDESGELPPEARAALTWREETGGLAIFVTWLESSEASEESLRHRGLGGPEVRPRRLRIGVRDPAGIVARIELVATGLGPPARVYAERQGDRWEARVPAEAPALHVLALGPGDRVLAHLSATDAALPPPTPTGRSAAVAEPPAPASGPGLSTGVFIAALVLGMLLVGGGVLEELRR